MRYFVLSGVPREEFLADDLPEASERAKLSAKNNDQASVWVEVLRYERSEVVTEVLATSEILREEISVSLAESGNGDDVSGSR